MLQPTLFFVTPAHDLLNLGPAQNERLLSALAIAFAESSPWGESISLRDDAARKLDGSGGRIAALKRNKPAQPLPSNAGRAVPVRRSHGDVDKVEPRTRVRLRERLAAVERPRPSTIELVVFLLSD
jgi:hypothetical protein